MYYVILSRGIFIFSVFACLYAMYGWSADSDIWLASTQWMLIAIFLLVMAIFVRISEADDLDELNRRSKTVKKNGKKKTTKKAKKNEKHKSFVLTEE